MRWVGLVAALAAGCGPKGLVVQWSYQNVVDGYDHPSRLDVYVDGEKVAESKVQPESVPGTLPVPLAPGAHQVRVVAMALYEGRWEEHLVENDYGIDCLWEGTVEGKERLKLVFDIDQGTVAR